MKLILIGFGVVGQNLLEILSEKKEMLVQSYGFAPRVVAVCDIQKGSVYREGGLDLKLLLSMVKKGSALQGYPGGTTGWDAFHSINEAEGDVVLELTWTNLETGEPAISHIRAALERGMHAVTSNKGPMVLAGRDLLALAQSRGVTLGFEATVMSGTPALNLASRNLAGCCLREIRGILNGTTNFILTEMEKGKTYQEALEKAQGLGFAEADPAADVEGWDPLAKIIILSNLLMNGGLRLSDARREGITGLTRKDIQSALEENKRWKLVARACREGEGVWASVLPEKVSQGDPLYFIDGAANALSFDTDLLGKVTIIGPGAGGRATGFALLSDLLEIHRLNLSKFQGSCFTFPQR